MEEVRPCVDGESEETTVTISVRTLLIGGAILLVVLAVLVGGFVWTWHSAALREVRAEMDAQRQDEIKAQHETAIKQRDEQVQQERARSDNAISEVKTLQQGVAAMQRAMKGSSVHATVQEQAAAQQPIATISAQDIAEEVRKKLPDSPSYAVMTEAQATLWGKIAIDYPTVRQQLQTCQEDNADLRAVSAADASKAKIWEQAAKGGSRWERFSKDALRVGIGAAIGYAIGGRKK